MTCRLGPPLGADVCQHAEDHDRYFSTERCFIREHALDLGTEAGSRALCLFVLRRRDLCRPALTGWGGSFSFCVVGALRAWPRSPINSEPCRFNP